MNNVKFEESEIQQQASAIARNEVYSCVTRLVEYVLSKSMEGDTDAPIDWEEIPYHPDPVGEEWNKEQLTDAMNDYGIEWGDVCEYGLSLDPLDYWDDDEAEGPDWIRLDQLDDSDLEYVREYIRDNVEFDAREIFEWWMVSDWLARQLQERGEIVVDGDYWGRQCTGQSIYMDPPFRDIAIKALSW